MDEVTSAESPLEAAAGAAGRHATDAFTLLGNETRLAVLLALWEAYDPHASDNAVSFSRILDRVETDDPGNLSYHLDKLADQFVRQLEEGDGYELRETGLALVRTVIAGAGVRDTILETTEIDQRCPFCDGTTAIRYGDGVVVHLCTECEGGGPAQTDLDGFLSAVRFDPAGLEDRRADEIRAASRAAAAREVRSLFDGLCPACSGRVDGWLDCCTDHDPTGNCGNCGMKLAAWARFQCRVCKNHSVSSPKQLALFHPAVVSFYDDHGVSTRRRADDPDSVERVWGLVDDHEMEIVSEDPPRVVVGVSRGEEEVRLTFDETADVADVGR